MVELFLNYSVAKFRVISYAQTSWRVQCQFTAIAVKYLNTVALKVYQNNAAGVRKGFTILVHVHVDCTSYYQSQSSFRDVSTLGLSYRQQSVLAAR